MIRATTHDVELASTQDRDRFEEATRHAVARRAYEISQRRPRDAAADDWFQAERSLSYAAPARMVRLRDRYVLRVLVDGYPTERLRCCLDGGRFVVWATRPTGPVVATERWMLDDFEDRNLYRSIQLPFDADLDRAEIDHSDGWIEVRLPVVRSDEPSIETSQPSTATPASSEAPSRPHTSPPRPEGIESKGAKVAKDAKAADEPNKATAPPPPTAEPAPPEPAPVEVESESSDKASRTTPSNKTADPRPSPSTPKSPSATPKPLKGSGKPPARRESPPIVESGRSKPARFSRWLAHLRGRRPRG